VRRGAAHVAGFDISEAEIERARDAAEKAGCGDRIEFRVADAHDTGFPDGAFELVRGASILHHLELEPALREIKRILRPGGKAVFVEPLGHNPILRIGRALTPMARTVDEHPLTVGDWATCARIFPRFRHFERELVTVPLMPLNLVLPDSGRQALAARVKPLDERVLQRAPKLRRYARVTFLVLQ
jgi:ubiquinone/menaquinone biosynthesis C-methylase UbiE